MSRRSGALQLATPAQTGEIVFRLGKVVAGYRSDAPESIGDAMLRQGLISPTQYQEMLGAQGEGKTGLALFDAFNLRGEALENVLEDALKRIIYAMFEWKDGTFSFVLDETAEPWQGFALERPRAVAERGLNPQYLAIEGARLRDERSKDNPLDALVALNETHPSAQATAASTEALARSLQPQTGVSLDDPPQKPADEDWSQVTLESSSSILPEVKLVPGPPPEPVHAPALPELPELAFLATEPPFPSTPAQAPSPVVPEAPAEAPLQALPTFAPAPSPESPQELPQEGTSDARSPYTLLVVDDDVQVLHHVREAFAERVVQVVAVSSVVEARRFLESLPQGLVVASDLIIARSDGGGILGGIEVLEIVRQQDAGTPVILFSDYQNEEADARARELNVTAQLVKPRKAQIYAEGRRGAVTAPMRDFLVRLDAVLAPFLAVQVASSRPLHDTQASTPPAQPEVPLVPPSLSHLLPLTEVTRDLREELASALDESGFDAAMLPPVPKTSGEMDALRSMVAEMRDASNHDAVSLLILRFASGVFERGALFLPTRRAFVGLGGFSQTEESEQFLHRVRRVQIAVEADSVFTQVVTYRTMVRAPLADVEGNHALIDGLGGNWHRGEVVAVPLISGDKIAAILFGDNPSGRVVGPTDGLEIFLQQAGLVLERALLERKLEESRRRDNTPR